MVIGSTVSAGWLEIIGSTVIAIWRKRHLLWFSHPKISVAKFLTQSVGSSRVAIKRRPWRVMACAASVAAQHCFFSENLSYTNFLPDSPEQMTLAPYNDDRPSAT